MAKSFICRGCLNPVTSAVRTSVDIGASAKLELVDKFCYLGDMLSVDGDADAAVEARIRIGWNKFRQLVPLLTNKDVSLIMRGRLYSSCVRSSMLHGSETWPVRKENVVALQQAEMRMVRWMCGVKLKDRLPNKVLVLQQNRLRWYGHVLRKDDNWVKKCMEYEVEGPRPRGRPKRTCVCVCVCVCACVLARVRACVNISAFSTVIKLILHCRVKPGMQQQVVKEMSLELTAGSRPLKLR